MWPFKKKTRLNHPEWLKDYLEKSFKTSASTYDIEFVVLDCETTGLAKSDEIITIGAVKCSSKEIYINNALDQKYPEVNSIGDSAEIHGELQEEIGETKKELIRQLIEYIDNHIIVGHNISFDIGMINQLLKKTYDAQLKNKVLDTARLAIRLDPTKYERAIGGKSGLHLDDLCEQFNINIENRHTALGDSYLTAQLLQKLLPALRKRGIQKVNQLIG